jgi:hypothetical protein
MKSERAFLGAAIALLSAFWYAPAFAQCVASDSLQLGGHSPVVLCESGPEGFATGGQAVDSIDLSPVPISPITTDLQISLTEPGSAVPAAVSDFVNVDPISHKNVDGVTILDSLDVTLVSDTGSPLNVSFGQIHIPETGAVQNLDSLITGFYGWTFTIPAVNVVSDVPEPSTWALLIVGFLGLSGLSLLRRSLPLKA